ncbi:helix-turn-helix domain-containing protein [Ruminococcus sp. OA3]|uniref:helix-turn-helix domain-containing protein n=1 Tax=Oscillospiraceae TaxID=216572 RepID=UPI001F05DA15|nr:AraC family transcriptional regulator [Ruminococcus sp. OA3]MCH1981178.1 helix-turn-helix domain-containing protein [Ruminococcus sp. OA3]
MKTGLETIAADLYFRTHYISHEFKNFFGMAPIQYLISRRIGEAHALLLQADMPVSAIARKVGYTNINNFYIQFKKPRGFHRVNSGCPPKGAAIDRMVMAGICGTDKHSYKGESVQ